MKIRADEHVSERIVRLVRDMTLSPTWELSHIAEEGQRGAADEHWATQFANEGGHAILSADKDFHTKPNQIIAIQRTGLKVIYLPAKWQGAQCHLQAAHVLLWWDRIEKKVKECKQREFWQTQWGFSQDAELVQKALHFQDAEKKLKKQNREARKPDEKRDGTTG